MQTKLNGIQIAYTDEDEGFPLLFIHGFPLNRSVWSKQVGAFKSKHRVIAPDLRGFGESESTAGPVAMSRYAEDIWALMQRLGTGPVILAGHSMGGYIALDLANRYPQAIRGLVLISTKSGKDTPEAAAKRRAMAEKVTKAGSAVVVDAMAPGMLSASNTDEAMAASVRAFMSPANPEGIIGALLGMAVRPDAGDWLGNIRVPTLVITGADDTVMPPGESSAMAKAIPDARLVVIPGAGHLVAFEQAEAFNGAIQEWLAWGRDGPLGSRFASPLAEGHAAAGQGPQEPL
jgi:pimeloyl-ACP methyl ester carboxylesterase